MKDSLFLDPGRRKSDFAFDESVALVFNDMIKRSVPFYFEVQNMIADLTERYALNDTQVYDLGCSTGTTLALLSKRLNDKKINYVGIDNSAAMLSQAATTLQKLKLDSIELRAADLNKGIQIDNGSVVIMNLVLQFIDLENRAALIADIFTGLQNQGCLLLVEKISSSNDSLEQCFTEKYYEFKKRNLYSDIEIARKRESLENILRPLTIEENIELLENAGFKVVETFFRWFNFAGLIAIKA